MGPLSISHPRQSDILVAGKWLDTAIDAVGSSPTGTYKSSRDQARPLPLFPYTHISFSFMYTRCLERDLLGIWAFIG
jgi:hypothetical protein